MKYCLTTNNYKQTNKRTTKLGFYRMNKHHESSKLTNELNCLLLLGYKFTVFR